MDFNGEMRLLVWTGGDDTSLCSQLADIAGVQVLPAASAAAAAAAMPIADAMIGSVIPWNEMLADALRNSPQLRWLQVMNAGYDNLEALRLPRHLRLSTLGALGSAFVAEHALTLLLAAMRALPRAVAAARGQQWNIPRQQRAMRSLRGSSIAIVGYGPIGRELALLLGACGATPIGIARSARVEAGVRVRPLTELHAVLSQVDAVVVCAPLKKATRRLLDGAAFAALREGAVVVNVSRGPIIDTAALCAALKSGRLRGAGLDVTDPEPLPPDHELWSHPGVVLTPHVAWAGAPAHSRSERIDFAVANVRRVLRGEQPLGLVEPEFAEQES
jgi:phosphoglycerate dehydrogenase-like enzyme